MPQLVPHRVESGSSVGTLDVTVTCVHCRQDITVVVPETGYELWQRKEYIQNAMPLVASGDRELLMTGICNDCWDKMFGGKEE